jgi:hypothetical protein
MGSETKALRKIVREECNNFVRYGKRVRASDIAILIQADHPDLIKKLSFKLVDSQLRRMCAETVKTWTGISEVADKQIVLPDWESHMVRRLPPAISMPIDGDKQDIEFVPARTATKSEWIKHLDYIVDQHKGLGQQIDAIKELLLRGGDCPDDASLFEFCGSRESVAA